VGHSLTGSIVVSFVLIGLGIQNLEFCSVTMEGDDFKIYFYIKIFFCCNFINIQTVGTQEFHHLGNFDTQQYVRGSAHGFSDFLSNDHKIVFTDFGNIHRIGKFERLGSILLVGTQQLFGDFKLARNQGFQKLDHMTGMLSAFEKKVHSVVFFLNFDTSLMSIMF
jgi:hypothetical protein